MPKGLLVKAGTNDYAFVSRSALYDVPEIAEACGIGPVSIPSETVSCPYRIEELLKTGVMFSATVYLDQGNNKRSSKRIYVSSLKRDTYKLLSTADGLVGQNLGGKPIISVSRSRKASFSI